MSQEKLLLIEDDDDLAFILKTQLQGLEFEMDVAGSLASAEQLLSERSVYDLVILDMMLPDASGLEICERIRRRESCPILFVSCISDKETIIEALKKGGDDYMVKPVDIGELEARIMANIRRSRKMDGQGKEILKFNHFVIEKSTHSVWARDGMGMEIRVELSPIEYQLLLLFAENKNKILLYEEMYRYIWKTDDLGDVRTVMVHVSNLRKKIDIFKTDMIHTVRGAGYIFSDV